MRVSQEEYLALLNRKTMAVKPTAKRTKYHNQKTEVDGITFDSKLEAKRWGELKLLEKTGEIRELERQVTYWLVAGSQAIRYDSGRRATYIADFVYRQRDGRVLIEDCKGCSTQIYKLKRAIMACMGYHIIEIRK